MGYFGTYLKRINRYGNTLQERIQNKKEHDFLVYMKKSPNLVRARNGDNKNFYEAVLQTKTYDQDEVTDYLLVPLEEQIKMGTIISTLDRRHFKIVDDEKKYYEKKWINYAIDPYTSSGYNRYTIVELESEITWVVDGIKYSSLAHAVGGGSGARDKNINLKFRMQFSEAGILLPNKRYSIVMPYHEKIKKNIKVTLGGETWRITGFDNISVQGVSYLTLEEAFQDDYDDVPFANQSDFENWEVTTSLGKDFTIQRGKETPLELNFYYKDKAASPLFSCIANENYKVIENDNHLTIITDSNFLGETSLKIALSGWNDRYLEIPFKIATQSGEELQIIGLNKIKMNQIQYYTVKDVEEDKFKTIQTSEKLELINTEYDEQKRIGKITIKGTEIGDANISIGKYNFNITVVSPWIGG